MNAEDWLRGQVYLVDIIEGAQAKLNLELDAEYRRVFGEDPCRCNRCNRIMVPRRIWYEIPEGMRYSAFVPVGKGDQCHACRIVLRRNSHSGGPLPSTEVSRLRMLVNFHSHQERRQKGA